jgi:hypothetical protein
VRLVCFACHERTDRILGVPFCPDCYDHDAQVVQTPHRRALPRHHPPRRLTLWEVTAFPTVTLNTYVHEWPDVLDRTRSLVDAALRGRETAATPGLSPA